MRFLVDENAGPSVAGWLRRQGHEVFSVSNSRSLYLIEFLNRPSNDFSA